MISEVMDSMQPAITTVKCIIKKVISLALKCRTTATLCKVQLAQLHNAVNIQQKEKVKTLNRGNHMLNTLFKDFRSRNSQMLDKTK